ncbi:MED7 protein-domain-containing protein [Mycena floridula]|nr:MED7 protein-domain-containing protein [Mycena floridula]
MEDEEAELRNPFPSPPSHYTKYTTHNLELLALLKERTPEGQEEINQAEVLSEQTDVPEWSLKQLEKPRVDWILEEPEAYYDVFGDRWFVKDKIPSLAELGGNQLYPVDPSIDRRPALLSILRSLLVTYSSLTSALLGPPPTNSTASITPEWQRHVEWIAVLGQNIMAAANDLRPVQARGNLELMMKRQLELRRQETSAIHAKCDALEAKLAELRASAEDISREQLPTSDESIDSGKVELLVDTAVEHDEVLRWAEEIT